MRILIATDSYLPTVGGHIQGTHRLARLLHKRGHTLWIVAPSPSTTLRNVTERVDGITIHRVKSILILKAKKFSISPKFLHRTDLQNLIARLRPNVVHALTPGPIAQTAATIAKKEGILATASFHVLPENILGSLYVYVPQTLKRPYRKRFIHDTVSFYNTLTAITCPTREALLLLKKAKVRVPIRRISNGVDLTVFRPRRATDQVERLRRKLRIPDKLSILYVGRLDKEKHVDVLIRACARLKEDFHLIIVGVGIEEKKLLDLARKNGVARQVTLTGYVNDLDLPSLYRMASVFVMPGPYELQSIATMEAMASGLAVVGANSLALPSLIANNENGFLFSSNSALDLSEKLSVLLADKKLRVSFGREGRRRAKEHDVRKVVVQFERFWKRAIRAPGS